MRMSYTWGPRVKQDVTTLLKGMVKHRMLGVVTPFMSVQYRLPLPSSTVSDVA